MAYDSQIIRIKADTSSRFTSPIDLITGSKIQHYSGTHIDIQVGVFDDGAVADISDFASIRFEIKPRNADGSPPDEADGVYVSKVVSTFDTSLSVSTWKDKSKQHFVISLTSAEMTFPVGDHWCSCFASTSGGESIVLFAGDFKMRNPGTDMGTLTYADLGESYYTAAQTDANFVAIPNSPSDGHILVYDADTSSYVSEAPASGALNDVVEDTTPQLGGSLDVNGKEITGAIDLHSSGNIIQELGDASGTNKVSIRDSSGTEVAFVNSDGDISGTDLTLTGNITVGGTVDGRDLATDGTKLDAIEAAADVTDATNVAAAGAIMDSDISSNGVMVRTASGTYTSRTISGTTDQITVSDGNGVSANPFISLSSDAFMPGNGAVRVPGGTTAQRPSPGTEGQLRRNTSNNTIEYYDGFSWVDLTSGAAGGIASVSADTSPSLGGTLDTNEFFIRVDSTYGIQDEVGNEQLTFNTTASAVNYLRITNSATGNAPSLRSAGDDTNINLELLAKGTGNIKLGSMIFDADQSIGSGQDDFVLTYDDSSGTIRLEAASGGSLSAVAEDIIPDADSTRDLGATGTRWAETYTDALDVTNNIVVGGTVDGRDIATDGTKLDGIESGADVTDATNVDAAGAVMNSDTSTASMSFVIDEDDMASDSATKVPTQQSVKAYVDASAGGGSGGLVYITGGTASSSSSLDFTDCFSATYDAYKIVISNITAATDGARLTMLFSTDSGSSWVSSGYRISLDAQGFNGVEVYDFSNSTTQANLIPDDSGWGLSNAATEEHYSTTINIYKPFDSGVETLFTFGPGAYVNESGNISLVTGGGTLSASEVDSVRFIMSTGNIGVGDIRIYGIKNS